MLHERLCDDVRGSGFVYGHSRDLGMIWFIAILLGAALSPPDPLSMFLVGGPIILLLEIALLVDKILRR